MTPDGKALYCDLISSDLLDVPIASFVLYHDFQKGVGGLVIELCAVLGTLKNSHVDERGGCLGSIRCDL